MDVQLTDAEIEHRRIKNARRFLIVCGLLLVAIAVVVGPMTNAVHHPPGNILMQNSRQIAQCLLSYAQEHDNRYPEGNSSTEVFQKLIDTGYCQDPSIFYVPLPSKKPALPGQKLKPENVCWDLTLEAEPNSPEGLPIVFMTGYKVTYAPSAAAVALIKPYPEYGDDPPKFPYTSSSNYPAIAVSYGGNDSLWIHMNNGGYFTGPDGTLPNFVPSSFKPDGHTYHQLTPEGILP